MQIARRLDLVRFGWCALACLALASCGKKIGSAGRSTSSAASEVANQSRLDWNLDTLVGAYQKVGRSSAAWDEPAISALTAFAHLRSRVPPGEDANERLLTNCTAAVAAGCDDPMIRYLYVRSCMSETNGPKDFAAAFSDVARAMQSSSYPMLRKTYATIRALRQLNFAYETNMASVPGCEEIASWLWPNIMATIQDPTLPPDEAYDLCQEGLKQYAGDAKLYAKAITVSKAPSSPIGPMLPPVGC